MIDLRIKGLPETIVVNGDSFLIKTDFREWLKFGELIKKKDLQYEELEYLFVDRIPLVDYFPALLDFYTNDNATPKKAQTGTENVLDYILDGEYIFGSFWAEYGLNLAICDLHWHEFKALFLCLPDNSKIKEIMGIRGYKKTSKKEEQIRQELKEIWALPTQTEIDEDLLQEINDLFYNS